MMMKKNVGITVMLLAMLMCVFAVGCANKGALTKNTYTTLATSAEAYDAAMHTLGDLYAEGKISDSQKDTAIKYGEKFWVAYHSAVDALDAYHNAPGAIEDKKETVYVALSVLSKALVSFLEYSQNLTEGDV